MVVHKRRATAIRRQEIIDVAHKLVNDVGSEKLTIRAIAQQIGISQSAIYRHFNSKKDILLQLVDNTYEQTSSEFNKAFIKASTQNEPYLEALKTVIRDLFQDLAKNIKGDIFRELYRLGDPELNTKIIEDSNKRVNDYKLFLTQAIQLGEIRKDLDIDATALLLFCMWRGLINTWGIGNNQTRVIEDKFDIIWNLFQYLVTKQN